MTNFLIFVVIPIALFGLMKVNADGSYTANSKSLAVGVLLLFVGLALWMFAMGSLRGVFAYLGLITVLGLAVSFKYANRAQIN